MAPANLWVNGIKFSFSKLQSVKKRFLFHCGAALFTGFSSSFNDGGEGAERVKQYFLDRSILKTTTVRNNLLLKFLCTKFMNYDGRFFQFFLHTSPTHHRVKKRKKQLRKVLSNDLLLKFVDTLSSIVIG